MFEDVQRLTDRCGIIDTIGLFLLPLGVFGVVGKYGKVIVDMKGHPGRI